MGKVLQFVPRGTEKQYEKGLVCVHPDGPPTLAACLKFVHTLDMDLKAFGVVDCPEVEIDEFLKTLHRRLSQRSIAIGETELKRFSLHDLRRLAAHSNIFEWKKRPGYFRALVRVINRKSNEQS